MNLTCLTKGHEYKKEKEIFVEDTQDAFMASNYGTSIYVAEYGHDLYICQRCLKQKSIPNGKRK